MTSPKPFRAQVGRYYDAFDAFYETVWGETLHCGFWPEGDDSSLSDAQERLTALMIAKSGVRAGQSLLDVGCGTGRPAIRAALETGCRVTGITVSRTQIRSVRRRARDMGGSRLTCFMAADAMALPFVGGAFDAAWAVESLFHIPDRARALGETARVLREGGRLVLTDLIERRPLRDEERELIQPFFAIHGLCAPGDYDRLLPQAGLREEERIDATAAVLKTWEKTMEALAEKEDELASLYGPALVEAVTDMVPRIAAVYRDRLSYLILVACKPSR